MDEKVLMLILGLAFGIIQLVLFIVSRNTSKEIIAAITKTVDSFNNHVVESNSIYTKVSKLEEQHSVTDTDGRPLWYTPRSLIKTQEDIVECQRNLSEVMNRLDRKFDEHQKDTDRKRVWQRKTDRVTA